MKYYGVVYDVGLRFTAGQPYSVEPFEPTLVAHDIDVIANQLHANTIRIEGEEIDRLVGAARNAVGKGLNIFFNPWKMNVPVSELTSYYSQAAEEAEKLRSEGAEIVFVAGCEMTLFNEGILEGSSIMERVTTLTGLSQDSSSEEVDLLLAERGQILNNVLQGIVKVIRERFHGPVTYAAGMWEIVDWSMFDIVGLDHYRSNETAKDYVTVLDRYRIGKPLVVMELGSCAYEGAALLGAGGFMRLLDTNPDGTGTFIGGIIPTRSESEQANYVKEQLVLLNGAQISGVFIYVFSFPSYRWGEGASDLDMMSFSLVKTYPHNHPKSEEMPPWELKEAFHCIASIYRNWSKKA